MCTGQLKDISDSEYKSLFFLLEPDDKGNVSYNVLIKYLTSVYGLKNMAVLAILQHFNEKNTNVLNEHQFVDMIKRLNGINESVAETCKYLFEMYDTNDDGYVKTNDLIGSYILKFLYRTDVDALETIRRFDVKEDEKLNFIDFVQFYINQ